MKHSKLGAKNVTSFPQKLFKKHKNGHYSMQIFKIFPGKHALGQPNPLESFLVRKLLKINSAEKNALEKVTKIGASFFKKILNTPLT